MHKIWLIIKREYLVRVRKKSFIIMTILGPLLMVSLLVLPAYLASESQEERIIAISEEDKEFNTKLEDTEYLHFTTIPNSEANELKNDFSEKLWSKPRPSLEDTSSKYLFLQIYEAFQFRKLKYKCYEQNQLHTEPFTVKDTTSDVLLY